MKFSTRADIEAPAGVVFEHLSDFARYERQLRRRGVDLKRRGSPQTEGPGLGWVAKFRFRGKPIRVQAELIGLNQDESLTFLSKTKGIDADFGVELIILSPKRTRMRVGLEVRPHTLPARLLVQSLKFSKSNLDRRFSDRVSAFARSIEVAYNPSRALRPE